MAISKSYFRWSDSVISTRSPTDPIELVPAYTPWHPDDDANFPASLSKGGSYYNPVYGTLITRISDSSIDRAPDYDGPIFAPYSRHQLYNSDGTRLLLLQLQGSWIVYDSSTFQVVKALQGLTPSAAGDQCEIHWHPTDPDKVRYSAYQGQSFVFYERDVVTDQVIVLFDLTNVSSVAGYPSATSILDVFPTATRVWNAGEGRCSADCNTYGWLIEEGTTPLGAITYDITTNSIIGVIHAADWGGSRPNHGSMTPSGRYYTISGSGAGTRAYKTDFSGFVMLHHRSEHSDLGLMPSGNDFYFSLDFQDNDGRCFWVDIDAAFANPSAINNTSAISRRYMTDYLYGYGVGGLNPMSTAFHASARCTGLPGWVIVSCYDNITDKGWSHGQIFAVEMADDPRIFQIAHGNNHFGGEYWAEMFATINIQGDKVVFPSNWGDTVNITSNQDAYQVSLPSGTIPNHRDVL